MTILGFHASLTEALVWCDSEVMKAAGSHLRFRNKMAVNPLAGSVLVSTGWQALAREAARTFGEVRQVDEAADLLPKRLRNKTLELIELWHDPGNAYKQSIFVIGFSAMAGRVVAYELRGENWFEPELNVTAASPPVTHAIAGRLPSMIEIGEIAREQMTVLRRDFPGAQGGTLTVAHIRGRAVSTMPAIDLIVECPAHVPALAVAEAA